ncbi:hypothetical protein AFULGI_00016490 [Archaeoglobus fulgidus DSM 8774]|uniref:Uncharacterized protein n=1 Tax=Archaeoglobus fulgidus DSM 8774 TaxID=1344584 RepID=A0A075WLF5_ARCFL|nr:hypothetical protein [Archaeoglobus fulgidus]AIG98408.1 hypothetical protein AFULGI_00016490 [Archaeoglobus fulgidus DSM 8774]
MYAVRKWDEEVIKWMAVGMVLAMVGLAVMPVSVGDVGAVIGGIQAGMNANSWEQAVVNGAWNGFTAGGVGAGVYLGLVALGVATGGTAFAVGLGIAL